MNFFLRRALLHITLFIVLLLGVLTIAKHYPETFYWSVFGTAPTIISAFALINLFGEIAFVICLKKEDKSSLFKILVIRTIKFLLYLALTIPFLWFVDKDKTFFGLLIVCLFVIYVMVEFSFFRNFERRRKKD